jgi:hypothetical protein
MTKKILYFAALALLSAGCTSLPPMRTARSLEDGKAQGSLILQSVDAPYTKETDYVGSPPGTKESQIADLAAVAGEFRGGTQAPGLEIGAGLGSLSSLYLDFKYQMIGKPWREGFAAALDTQVDYFPFTFYNENNNQISNGFGGSAGLTFGQFIGLGDLNIGGRFGTVPAGTLYAYYTLFDVAGLRSPSSNYYEIQANLDFILAKHIGLNIGGAYRTYLRQSADYADSYQDVRIGLPGFFVAAMTLSFGGQPGLDENDKPAAPKPRLKRKTLQLGQELSIQGKAELETKNYEKALIFFKEAGEAGVDDEALHMRMAYCFYQMKDWDNALLQYQKAQDFDPEDPRLKSAIEKLEKKTAAEAQPAEDAPLPK